MKWLWSPKLNRMKLRFVCVGHVAPSRRMVHWAKLKPLRSKYHLGIEPLLNFFRFFCDDIHFIIVFYSHPDVGFGSTTRIGFDDVPKRFQLSLIQSSGRLKVDTDSVFSFPSFSFTILQMALRRLVWNAYLLSIRNNSFASFRRLSSLISMGVLYQWERIAVSVCFFWVVSAQLQPVLRAGLLLFGYSYCYKVSWSPMCYWLYGFYKLSELVSRRALAWLEGP